MLGVAALAAVLAGAGGAPAAPEPAPLTVVQANVGNINGACADQRYKLCQRPVERRAAKALRALHPDVVGFEEILPEAVCKAEPARAAANLCSSPRSPTSQAARLLGHGYRVTCATRFGYECLAVRRGSGVRTSRLTTRKVQPGCDDPGFTMDRATLRLAGSRVALLLGHPESMVVPCRARQIRDGFGTLPGRGPILALGDFNLDPFREHDASVRAFDRARARLGLRLVDGRAITLLPGESQLDPTGRVLDTAPLTGLPPNFSHRTIDHVLVRGWRGSCHVRRVDGGGGMDHRAQVCTLRLRG